jgi:hypothetical protein
MREGERGGAGEAGGSGRAIGQMAKTALGGFTAFVDRLSGCRTPGRRAWEKIRPKAESEDGGGTRGGNRGRFVQSKSGQ